MVPKFWPMPEAMGPAMPRAISVCLSLSFKSLAAAAVAPHGAKNGGAVEATGNLLEPPIIVA